MSDIIKIKASPEQKKFFADKQAEANKWYKEHNALVASSWKIEEDIATATIGFGKAITIMTDKSDRLKKEIKQLEKNQIYSDQEFQKEFGISWYSLDFS